MALDRWFPTRFAHLSDRFVTQNGILLMGGSALVMMAISRGSVGLLVVLYSINVFITFSLSQLGMVRHWWRERRSGQPWLRRLSINGFGLVLTLFILISLTAVKFTEGGWATLFVTGLLVLAAFAIQRHYRQAGIQLKRLDAIVAAVDLELAARPETPRPLEPNARTAIVLVNGYNGLGLHTVLNVPRYWEETFANIVFLHVGAVDAGNFKGVEELDALRAHTVASADRYVRWAQLQGFGSTSFTTIGHDVTDEIMRLADEAAARFPNHVFFAGELAFRRETRITRWLHNATADELRRRFHRAKMPFVVVPIQVPN
jgi:hypothetical protein